MNAFQLASSATSMLELLPVPVEETKKAQPKPQTRSQSKASVDDDFCRTSDFRFLLEYGWKPCGKDFTRPGKDHGLSASIITAEDGTRLLHVFTSSAPPFEKDKNYNAFDAYCLLNHGGDAEVARAALLKQGFGGLRIPLIDCAELDSTSYELDYLIDNVLVAKQPCLVAGPKKALKTSILIALAIALATGRDFLGRMTVKRPCKVIVLSGESGMATLQETARRICKSIGIVLSRVTDLFWSDFLPTFDDPRHLDALERMVKETGCEVLIVDPAYLCMPGTDAGNLFIMGSLLRRVSEICQRHAVGLVLAHHMRKQSKARNQSNYAQPELDDMAWSGFAEFARQWLLIGRREEFVPGSGEHRLWLSIGGSAGHSALWAVDIDEGVSGEPRHWEVSLSSPTDARTEKKARSIRQRLLDAAREFPNGETKTRIFNAAKLKSDIASQSVFEALVDEGLLVPHEVPKNGVRYDGFRLSEALNETQNAVV